MRFLHQMPTILWHANQLSAFQRYTATGAVVGLIAFSWFYFIQQTLVTRHTHLINQCESYAQQQEYQETIINKKKALEAKLAQLSAHQSTSPLAYQVVLKELIKLADKANLRELQLIPQNESLSCKKVVLQAVGDYTDIAAFFSALTISKIALLPSEISIEQQLEGNLQLLAQIAYY